jgi:hypothetical protein
MSHQPIAAADVRALDPAFFKHRMEAMLQPGGVAYMKAVLGEDKLFFVSEPGDGVGADDCSDDLALNDCLTTGGGSAAGMVNSYRGVVQLLIAVTAGWFSYRMLLPRGGSVTGCCYRGVVQLPGAVTAGWFSYRVLAREGFIKSKPSALSHLSNARARFLACAWKVELMPGGASVEVTEANKRE